MSWANQTKDASTWANQAFGNTGLTWDEATFTWDEATGTWNNAYEFTNQTKNTSSWTNQTKD